MKNVPEPKRWKQTLLQTRAHGLGFGVSIELEDLRVKREKARSKKGELLHAATAAAAAAAAAAARLSVSINWC